MVEKNENREWALRKELADIKASSEALREEILQAKEALKNETGGAETLKEKKVPTEEGALIEADFIDSTKNKTEDAEILPPEDEKPQTEEASVNTTEGTENKSEEKTEEPPQAPTPGESINDPTLKTPEATKTSAEYKLNKPKTIRELGENIRDMRRSKPRGFLLKNETNLRQTGQTEAIKTDTEKEITAFIATYGLESLLPPGFNELSIGQKLLVIRSTEKRIVDLAKGDAQTQYSKDVALKGKIKGALTTMFLKDRNIHRFEVEAFKKIKGSKEGQLLVSENLRILTSNNKNVEVVIRKDGTPEIIFISPDQESYNASERIKINEFNALANEFRDMPYEWGQSKGKNKKRYDEVKAKYQLAVNGVVKMEVHGKKKDRAEVMIDMLQMDKIIKIEQLINTHPEVEAALDRMSKGDPEERRKLVANALNTLAGGKGWTNKLIFGGSFIARGSLAFLGSFSLIPVVAVGTAVGGVRGWARGKNELIENKKRGRYGIKNKIYDKEDKVHTENSMSFGAENLADKLEKLIEKAQDPSISKKDLSKILGSLSARINYTQSKIEGGEVNFGLAENSLVNQYKLISALNDAIVLNGLYETKNNELDQRLKSFSDFWARDLKVRQKEFITEKIKQGAEIGFMASSLGWTVRHVLSYFHILEQGVGDHATEVAREMQPKDLPVPAITHPVDTIKIPHDTLATDSAQMKVPEKLMVEPNSATTPPQNLVAPTPKASTEELIQKARSQVEQAMSPQKETQIDVDNIILPGKPPVGDVFTETHEHIDNIPEPTIKLDPLHDTLNMKVAGESDVIITRQTPDGNNVIFGASHTEVSHPAEHFDPTHDDRPSGQNVTYGPVRNYNYTEPFVSPQIMQEASRISEQNLHHIFPDNMAREWNTIGPSSANQILEISPEMAEEKGLTNLQAYMHRLEEVTGLEPKGRSLFNWKPETVSDFFKRATEWAARNNKLEDIRIL